MGDWLRITVYGLTAGVLRRRTKKALEFTYDDEYRRHRGATPLSLSLPLTARVHQGSALSAFLWGLLPDNDEVVRRWARQAGVTADDVVGLLAYVGRDVAGAVQFFRPGDDDEPGDLEPVDDEWIGRRLRALHQNAAAWTPGLDKGLFSLAGAQPKMALRLVDGEWSLPSGASATTHIFKPTIAGLVDHDVNEHLCMAAAAGCGVVTAATEVREFAGERAIVVRRYDRIVNGHDVVRVHQEDMCQALAVPPERRYQSDGGPSVEQIIDLIRRVQPPRDTSAVAAFVDGLLVNWIIAGADAHAKNYSLLLSGRTMRFAPLYDVASVLPIEEIDLFRVKSAMKIGGTYDLGYMGGENWRRLAKDNRLNVNELMGRAETLCLEYPQRLAQAAADPHIAALPTAMPEVLVEAVEKRARRCLERL